MIPGRSQSWVLMLRSPEVLCPAGLLVGGINLGRDQSWVPPHRSPLVWAWAHMGQGALEERRVEETLAWCWGGPTCEEV